LTLLSKFGVCGFFGEKLFEKSFSPNPSSKTFTAFYFFLGKLLKKFSQTLSKLSQHFSMRESFSFFVSDFDILPIAVRYHHPAGSAERMRFSWGTF